MNFTAEKFMNFIVENFINFIAELHELEKVPELFINIKMHFILHFMMNFRMFIEGKTNAFKCS